MSSSTYPYASGSQPKHLATVIPPPPRPIAPADPVSRGSQAGPPLPALHLDALQGWAGRAARLLAPEDQPTCDLHPAPVLLSLLTLAGSMMGRSVMLEVGEYRARTNLYAVLVGVSGAGKGRNFGSALRLCLHDLDADGSTPPVPQRTGPDTALFGRLNVYKHFGSGEALISRVAWVDVRSSPTFERDEGDHEELPEVSSVLWTTNEFATLLIAKGRQGSTLGPVLTDAYDGGPLGAESLQHQARAGRSHLSVVGQVTPEALAEGLGATDLRNGFANRFLYCFVPNKEQRKPYAAARSDLYRVADDYRERIGVARSLGPLHLDDEADALDDRQWQALRAVPDDSGLAERFNQNRRRLIAIYAALDGTKVVRAEHVAAAGALIDYCRQTNELMLPRMAAKPSQVKRVLDVLRRKPDGVTRTQLSQELGHNFSKATIDDCLGVIRLDHTLTEEHLRHEDPGRPTTVYRLT